MATILVVDDKAANRDFLVTLRGYCGHRLLQAAKGTQPVLDSQGREFVLSTTPE